MRDNSQSPGISQQRQASPEAGVKRKGNPSQS
jgi:hypothetical protein